MLTFQTIGSLVSPKVFKFLKNKHIKKVIFKTNPGTLGLIHSLKHIKKQLTTNETILGYRKVKDNPGPGTSHMIKFIRDNLKTNFNAYEKPKPFKDPIISSMGQTFYN